ncbi:MAG: ABC transporter substrate-binding protein [Spirochaetes bacterium]|nr:ABC transporter substrate-binding protein [Spirochaetota bacterium]
MAVLTVASCSKSKSPSDEKTIKIGALWALTGWWYSAYDNSIMRMTEAAVDMINEDGGITVKGEKYKIELVIEDTQSTFDGVTAAANRLIHEKGVKLIVGPSGFFVSPATPVTKSADAMMIVGWHLMIPGEIDSSTPYNFGTSQGQLPKDIAIIKSMRRDYPKAKRLAVVSSDDGSTPFIIPKVNYYLKENGFTRVGDLIKYPDEMEDFSPIVARILSLKNYDAVFIEKAPPPALAAMVKGLREKGVKVPVFTASPISTHEVSVMIGTAATEGVRTTIDTYNDPNMTSVMKEMSERVAEKYGKDFPMSFQCAVGVYLYKTLIEAAQSFEPKDLKKQFESMDEIDTIYGKAPICGEKFFGIKHIVAHPMPIQKFEGGKAIPAKWVEVGTIP